jgi:Flp pilus assembly pilin Flp
MISNIRKFWKDESGPELVEWAVVTIILLVAAVILYIAVGRALGSVICSIRCWLDKIDEDHDQITGSDVCEEQGHDCDQEE